MKQSRINLVIVLSVISLGGIIYMQGIWLLHASENNSRHFDNSVNEALTDVVATMEKRSVYHVFKRHVNADTLREVTVQIGGDPSEELNIDLKDSITKVLPNADTLKYVHHHNQQYLMSGDNERLKFTERIDSILGDIITDLRMDTLMQAVPFPPLGLDTVIKNSLRQQGIRNSFEYAVTGVNGGIMHKSQGFDSSLSQMVYKVQLMPANLHLKSGELMVIMHNRTEFVIHTIGWFILTSVIFTAVIVITFWLTIRTILKQKKISRVKNDFINNMTHEFKTPLATIGIAADALKDNGIKPAQVGQFAEIIKQESRNMNQKVETILQMALLEQQQLKLELKKTDIHVILKEVLDRMQLPLEKNNAIVTSSFNATQHYVMGDALHLGNVFENIFDNAVKYSSGRPQIDIKTNNTGKTIVIGISDNGIGMTPEEVKRAFDRFYRAQGGNLHNTKGFGLGLSYAQEIISLHNGTIEITGQKNKGTTVTVTLPVYE